MARGKVLRDPCGSQEQASVHAWPGFVASNGTRPHFHAGNGLLGGIVGPRDFRFGLKGTVGVPILAQAQEEIPQLFQRRAGLIAFGTPTRQLFPEGIEGLTPIGWQDVKDVVDLFQDP